MQKIELSKNQYTIVDDDDYEKLSKYKWYLGANRYAVRTKWGKPPKMIYMHREILGYKGVLVVDHIDGNGLNNQKNNLRIITQQLNVMNRTTLNTNNTSGFRGISYLKSGKRIKRWTARIPFNGKKINLPYFATKEEAVRAWEIKYKQLYEI